jgi:cytidyltransferase-like protein
MSAPEQPVAVMGAFDSLRSSHLRFLEEAAKLGPVTVFLCTDAAIEAATGKLPHFPLAERRYVLEAVRFVQRVVVPEGQVRPDELPVGNDFQPAVWVDGECAGNTKRRAWCRERGLAYQVLTTDQLRGFPEAPPPKPSNRKKVIVTGCYDWFHSGHVRFFEEASAYGDLYVVVGSDANIRLLKGEGHPLLRQDERRYTVGCVRSVTQALISSGKGWLDAEPEIERLQPQVYAVNEDGDKGSKREFCLQHGIEYLVLKRTPAAGLPARTSTELRALNRAP